MKDLVNLSQKDVGDFGVKSFSVITVLHIHLLWFCLKVVM